MCSGRSAATDGPQQEPPAAPLTNSSEVQAVPAAQSDPPQHPPLLQLFSAHLMSETVTRTMWTPFDRIKYLLQTQQELIRQERLASPYRGAVDCAKRTITAEGLTSLFKGNCVNIASVIPTAMAQVFVGVPVQERILQTMLNNEPDLSQNNAPKYFIASFIAAFSGATCVSLFSYPFDVLRFRLTCDVRATPQVEYLFRNSTECVSKLLYVERPACFYRGLGLYLTGSVLYRTSYLMLYDAVFNARPWRDQSEVSYWMEVAGSYAVVCAATATAYPIDTVRRRVLLTLGTANGYSTSFECAKRVLQSEGVRGLYRGLPFHLFRTALVTVAAVLASKRGH